MIDLDLIGLSKSDAVSILNGRGIKYNLKYYLDERQKDFDSEFVIRVVSDHEGGVTLLLGRFLTVPKEQEENDK